MTSPAERYAAAHARNRDRSMPLARFRASLPFELDDFQERACRALEDGDSVLVAAPTGAGKTVVGEFAVFSALQAGGRAFYTTPIKALSNQKYGELRTKYGADAVGLLTGDNSINADASVIVMTTEVLRNMLYEGSASLRGLTHVVMDEVHYLADRSRGAVWEEVLIQLPQNVLVTALSATVSNAEEFGEWLGTVRGSTRVVVEEHRPVPLFQHVAVDRRLLDLFVRGDRVNPELAQLAEDARVAERRRGRERRGGYRRARGGPRSPGRAEVIARLDAADLLPAITFIFSRAGCDSAAASCVSAGLCLTSEAEAEEIRVIAETRCAHVPGEDLALLGFDAWVDMLTRGIAAHHAGMLPTFKEVVEELFQRGLVRAVFATETLALGINMPARSVVLERLSKWNGVAHAALTPGEYTQLTGRAGRRGIDVEGHAVVVWHDDLHPSVLAGLASTRTYPLRSSFHPSYNMAVNLVDRHGVHQAREMLETSFAQFQADRSVVGMAAKVRRLEEAAEGYREAMDCHMGDMAEYAGLRRRLSEREKDLSRRSSNRRRDDVRSALAGLRKGDVIPAPSGRRTGPVAVVDAALDRDDPRPQVLTVDRQVRRIAVADFQGPPEVIARVKVPRDFHARNPKHRRDLAAALRAATDQLDVRTPRSGRRREAADDAEIQQLRRDLRRHPCHGCAERDDHLRWADRLAKIEREIAQVSSRVNQRTNTVARQFDRVCAVLADLAYLEGSGDAVRVTPAGKRLARIYNDNDLLAAEALRTGLWAGLNAPELAAAVSALVFERRTEEPRPYDTPTPAVNRVLRDEQALLADLKELEHDRGVAFLGELDPAFAQAIHSWTDGRPLARALGEAELPAGDFVRWAKQVADLLDQVAEAADPQSPVAGTATLAAQRIRRGVVQYSATV